jgi:very-short-patch-repair endonuclease
VTWFLLASELSHRDLVAAGDFFVTGRRLPSGKRAAPLCTPNDLADVVRENAGKRGATGAAAALRRVRVGVDSAMETFTRILIVDAGFAEPVVGFEVPVDGRTLHPDLAYPELRLAIEYEGEEHRVDPRRFRSDITRRELFEGVDWRVTRVTSDDVFVDPQAFLRRLRRIIDRRTSEIA